MRDKWRQNLTNIVANDEISDLVELGGLAIENDQTRPIAFGHQWEPGGWPHHQRRADGEKEITRHGHFFGTPHRRLRHRLPERHRRGLDVTAAIITIRRLS